MAFMNSALLTGMLLLAVHGSSALDLTFSRFPVSSSVNKICFGSSDNSPSPLVNSEATASISSFYFKVGTDSNSSTLLNSTSKCSPVSDIYEYSYSTAGLNSKSALPSEAANVSISAPTSNNFGDASVTISMTIQNLVPTAGLFVSGTPLVSNVYPGTSVTFQAPGSAFAAPPTSVDLPPAVSAYMQDVGFNANQDNLKGASVYTTTYWDTTSSTNKYKVYYLQYLNSQNISGCPVSPCTSLIWSRTIYTAPTNTVSSRKLLQSGSCDMNSNSTCSSDQTGGSCPRGGYVLCNPTCRLYCF